MIDHILSFATMSFAMIVYDTIWTKRMIGMFV